MHTKQVLEYKQSHAKALSLYSCGLAPYYGSQSLNADVICVDIDILRLTIYQLCFQHYFIFHIIEPCTIFIQYEYNFQTHINMQSCIWLGPTTLFFLNILKHFLSYSIRPNFGNHYTYPTHYKENTLLFYE